jgi:hypothetical protein
MKAYLITTGTIFGLLAPLHILKAIDEGHSLTANTGEFLAMVALGALTTALSVWAWCLFRRQARP